MYKRKGVCDRYDLYTGKSGKKMMTISDDHYHQKTRLREEDEPQKKKRKRGEKVKRARKKEK